MIRLILYLTLANIFATLAKNPNIVFILTDDQDIELGGMEYMTQLQKLIVEPGLTFQNGFVSSPVCCVSRSSIMTGRYIHNHHTINNSLAGGCSSIEWQKGVEHRAFAPHIRAAGYRTLYAGKYLNQYGFPPAGGVEHIPPGWTDWFGLVGNSRYYNYAVSDNGKKVSHGHNYTNDYFTDVLKRRGLKFLQDVPGGQPWLMVLATPAAHAPFTPAPQYANVAEGKIAPRTPSWNLAGQQDKHALLRLTPKMTEKQINTSDATFRNRHGTLKSVDDMVAAIYDSVGNRGELDNTYFFYSSDHGFHLGQFGMSYDKRQLYETDLRVPYYVRGPNVTAGLTTATALNVDFAPTFVELATGSVPDDMDGKSLVSILHNHGNVVDVPQNFLVEYHGEGRNNVGIMECGGGVGGAVCNCDAWNNTYQCIRAFPQVDMKGVIYCRFICSDNSHNPVPCIPGTVDAEGEYYLLDVDQWQLVNKWKNLTAANVRLFSDQLDAYEQCAGQDCNLLRESTFLDEWGAGKTVD